VLRRRATRRLLLGLKGSLHVEENDYWAADLTPAESRARAGPAFS
jgi:hypothetical protein